MRPLGGALGRRGALGPVGARVGGPVLSGIGAPVNVLLASREVGRDGRVDAAGGGGALDSKVSSALERTAVLVGDVGRGGLLGERSLVLLTLNLPVSYTHLTLPTILLV